MPSLISSWWNDCKDRQLSTAVATLTTKHYSPVLITAELAHIKDPVVVDELSGENWNIKVASGTGEVTASYTVDEQDMEIAVRLPPDYPLHSIEVRDLHRLGVDEKKWRGWLLAAFWGRGRNTAVMVLGTILFVLKRISGTQAAVVDFRFSVGDCGVCKFRPGG